MNLIRLKICRVHIWSTDVPFVVNFKANTQNNKHKNKYSACVRTVVYHWEWEREREERRTQESKQNKIIYKHRTVLAHEQICCHAFQRKIVRYIYKMPPVRFIGAHGVCCCCCYCSIAINPNRYTHPSYTKYIHWADRQSFRRMAVVIFSFRYGVYAWIFIYSWIVFFFSSCSPVSLLVLFWYGDEIEMFNACKRMKYVRWYARTHKLRTKEQY